MKRTFTSIITFVFLGFLLIGVISVVQNVFHEVQKTFSQITTQSHILAYQKV